MKKQLIEPGKWLIWYSGPHGSAEEAGDYGSVLLIATGYGIAA